MSGCERESSITVGIPLSFPFSVSLVALRKFAHCCRESLIPVLFERFSLFVVALRDLQFLFPRAEFMHTTQVEQFRGKTGTHVTSVFLVQGISNSSINPQTIWVGRCVRKDLANLTHRDSKMTRLLGLRFYFGKPL